MTKVVTTAATKILKRPKNLYSIDFKICKRFFYEKKIPIFVRPSQSLKPFLL
jgi:hypothetical protein